LCVGGTKYRPFVAVGDERGDLEHDFVVLVLRVVRLLARKIAWKIRNRITDITEGGDNVVDEN